jgi:hypothetical protein
MLVQTEELFEQSLDPVSFHCLADFLAHCCSQPAPLAVTFSLANIDEKVRTEVFPAVPVAQKVVPALRYPARLWERVSGFQGRYV